MADNLNEAVEAIKQGVAEAYAKVESKGGTMPSQKNLNNLSEAIESIQGGGGGVPANATVKQDEVTFSANTKANTMVQLNKRITGMTWDPSTYKYNINDFPDDIDMTKKYVATYQYLAYMSKDTGNLKIVVGDTSGGKWNIFDTYEYTGYESIYDGDYERLMLIESGTGDKVLVYRKNGSFREGLNFDLAIKMPEGTELVDFTASGGRMPSYMLFKNLSTHKYEVWRPIYTSVIDSMTSSHYEYRWQKQIETELTDDKEIVSFYYGQALGQYIGTSIFAAATTTDRVNMQFHMGLYYDKKLLKQSNRKFEKPYSAPSDYTVYDEHLIITGQTQNDVIIYSPKFGGEYIVSFNSEWNTSYSIIPGYYANNALDLTAATDVYVSSSYVYTRNDPWSEGVSTAPFSDFQLRCYNVSYVKDGVRHIGSYTNQTYFNDQGVFSTRYVEKEFPVDAALVSYVYTYPEVFELGQKAFYSLQAVLWGSYFAESNFMRDTDMWGYCTEDHNYNDKGFVYMPEREEW